MDKNIILGKLLTKKGKDYTYTIAFFLIFSFFVFFIIRPNILSIFQANLKIENLKKINALYESQIQNVINTQTVLIESRDNLILLNEALSERPQINQLIKNIADTVERNKLTINKLSLVNVNLKDVSKDNQMKTLVFDIDLTGRFDQYFELMKDFYNQRRLKLLKNIVLSKSQDESSPSGNLKIELQLEGYHL